MPIEPGLPFRPHFHDMKLVVFDLDGTLVDAFEDIADAVNAMLAQLDRPPMSVAHVKRHVGRGVRLLAAGVVGSNDEPFIERASAMIVDHYGRNPDRHARLYPGVLEVLADLRRGGIFTAVASNKPDALTRAIVERLGAAPLLDTIHGESARFPRKPAPDLLLHIMDQARATPAQTLVVGDTDIDIEFARNAGASVVTVTYGQYPEDYLRQHDPDAILHDLRELPGLIS